MAGLISLGKFTIAAGTTQLLTANVGPQKQTVLGAPAKTVRQIILTADSANAGQIFLLPAGQTAVGNPKSILAAIGKGTTVAIPSGIMLSGSIALDSYCLDADTGSQIVYGCAVVG